jgi:hypothetical protein
VIKTKYILVGGEVDSRLKVTNPVIAIHTTARSAAAPVLVQLRAIDILCTVRGARVVIPPAVVTIVVLGIPVSA